MMKQKIKTRIISLAALLAVSLLSANAALGYSASDNWSIAPENPGGLPEDLETSVKNAIDWLLGFVALLAVLIIIYGGVVYVGSGGDQDRTNSAKKTIKYAIMGLALAGIAYAAVNAIIVNL